MKLDRLGLVSGLALLAAGLAACGGPASEPETTDPQPAGDAASGEPEIPPIDIRGADPQDVADASAEAEADGNATDETAQSHDDEHSHDDDHAHDHDHAGGEAHVHGKGEAALVLEDGVLSVTMTAPLASFGARESAPETPEEEAAKASLRLQLADPSKLVAINSEARCIFAGSEVDFIYTSDTHGHADLAYTFNCARPEELGTLDFAAFETFPTLEEVDAVMLDGAQQSAATMTPGSASLSWPEG